MHASAADVFQTVEYSRDKWVMDKLPWGLVGIFVGLGFVVYTDPRPASLGPLILLGALLLLGLIFAVVNTIIDRLFDKSPAPLIWGILITVIVVLIVTVGVPTRSRRPDVPSGILGWMFVYFSAAFIAFALWRHVFPAKPFLRLTPAGLTFRLAYLREVLVPWHEVKEIPRFDKLGPAGHVTAITVSKSFFEQQILPRKRFAPGRSWDLAFADKGALMLMALPHPMLFKIDPNDIRAPVEARWKAFKDLRPATSVPTTKPKAEPLPRGPVLVYGRWSPKLTPWQAVGFALPLLGILAILSNAAGLWDAPSLRAARERAEARIKCEEDRKREADRDKAAGGSGYIIVSGRC